MTMRDLGTIAAEERACRKAWSAAPNATHAWHCHHDDLVEDLHDPAEDRINYIVRGKPVEEQAFRLRLFRPVRDDTVAPAWKVYDDTVAPAWKVYDDTVASARKVRDDTVAPARKVRDDTVAPAHCAECDPDCPWK